MVWPNKLFSWADTYSVIKVVHRILELMILLVPITQTAARLTNAMLRLPRAFTHQYVIRRRQHTSVGEIS